MTLPKGWTHAKLSDFTVDRVEQGKPEVSVTYIDIGSIDRDKKRVGATDRVTVDSAPTRARQWVQTGDVLVSLTRPNLNAVAIVTHEIDRAVASTGFDVLRSIGVRRRSRARFGCSIRPEMRKILETWWRRALSKIQTPFDRAS
jgi:type I restriction enzyme, S subunit